MNDVFININKDLNLKPYKKSNLTDINLITSNLSNYIRISKIWDFFPNNKHGNLRFSPVSLEDGKKKKKKKIINK